MRDIFAFISENKIPKISLIKLNIEGAEYDVLERLIETNYISNVDNILVQFHDFTPNAYERMKNIQTQLKQTHTPIFQSEYVWEHWQIL